MTAAPSSAVPRRVVRRSKPSEVGWRTARVVPRDVEARAEPAANACRGEAPRRGTRTKERARGRAMPVRAIRRETGRRGMRVGSEVVRPPVESALAKRRMRGRLDPLAYHM
jgi:hypothetical protein